MEQRFAFLRCKDASACKRVARIDTLLREIVHVPADGFVYIAVDVLGRMHRQQSVVYQGRPGDGIAADVLSDELFEYLVHQTSSATFSGENVALFVLDHRLFSGTNVRFFRSGDAAHPRIAQGMRRMEAITRRVVVQTGAVTVSMFVPFLGSYELTRRVRNGLPRGGSFGRAKRARPPSGGSVLLPWRK